MRVTLEQGAQYRATVQLRGFEALAGREDVEERLTELGFTGATATPWDRVSGRWSVEATWDREQTGVDVPEQVVQWERIG